MNMGQAKDASVGKGADSVGVGTSSYQTAGVAQIKI